MTQPDFLSFVKDAKSIAAIEAVIDDNGWSESYLKTGDIESAILTLDGNPSPKFLLVEIPSAKEAPDLLDKLADVCDGDTKVIVTSNVNEFSFYSWLKDIGIHEYLLQPITEASLKQALTVKAHAEEQEESDDDAPQTIAFIGARGGVGTTTIISNLAYLLSTERQEKTALFDLDIHNGSVAMCFDIESGNGLHSLLESPDRIDALFLERVISKYNDNLRILSSEAALAEQQDNNTATILTIIKELNAANRHTLIDLPRNLNNNTRKILEIADHVVIVTELSTLGLRDTTRLRDLLVDEIGKPEPIIIASRVGKMGNDEVKPTDFIKYYGHDIDVEVPYIKEAYTSMSTGEMLYNISKTPLFKRVMNQLANHFSDADGEIEQKQAGFFSKIMKGKG